METQTSISLIISTYNRPDALAAVLKSVCNQSHLPNEVIIADDGSTKETSEVIKNFKNIMPNLKHIWHEDQGFRLAAIRNKAILNSNSHFISMIDGDMLLHHDFIKSIQAHIKPNIFLQGKRVLLNTHLTQKILEVASTEIDFFSKGITNRFNTISVIPLSKILSRTFNKIDGVRGCSMHFWKEDAIKINGFNEDFVGWGREDSEFVCRLLNNGVQRKNIALGAVAYHLFHKEANRTQLPINDQILEDCIQNKLTWCPNGLKCDKSETH